MIIFLTIWFTIGFCTGLYYFWSRWQDADDIYWGDFLIFLLAVPFGIVWLLVVFSMEWGFWDKVAIERNKDWNEI